MTDPSASNAPFGWRDALARERGPVRIATSLGAVGLAVVFGLLFVDSDPLLPLATLSPLAGIILIWLSVAAARESADPHDALARWALSVVHPAFILACGCAAAAAATRPGQPSPTPPGPRQRGSSYSRSRAPTPPGRAGRAPRRRFAGSRSLASPWPRADRSRAACRRGPTTRRCTRAGSESSSPSRTPRSDCSRRPRSYPPRTSRGASREDPGPGASILALMWTWTLGWIHNTDVRPRGTRPSCSSLRYCSRRSSPRAPEPANTPSAARWAPPR